MSPFLPLLHQLPGITHKRLFLMRDKGTFQWWWEKAQKEDFLSLGVKTTQWEALHQKRIRLQDTMETITKPPFSYTTQEDETFPPLLRHIPGAPFVLYHDGPLPTPEEILIGVVGSRAMSAYGKQVCERFLPTLLSAGCRIISGFAQGVDQYAHRLSTAAKQHSYAILGMGLQTFLPYRPQHAPYITFISDFPLDLEANIYTFPLRNRLISGISRGTLIIEAKEKSGTLITARYALEQGRELWAVPGNIFSPTQKGIHTLVHKGEARLVDQPEQILEEYHQSFSSLPLPTETLTKEEQEIYLLCKEEQTITSLKTCTHHTLPILLAYLGSLESKKLLKEPRPGSWIQESC